MSSEENPRRRLKNGVRVMMFLLRGIEQFGKGGNKAVNHDEAAKYISSEYGIHCSLATAFKSVGRINEYLNFCALSSLQVVYSQYSESYSPTVFSKHNISAHVIHDERILRFNMSDCVRVASFVLMSPLSFSQDVQREVRRLAQVPGFVSHITEEIRINILKEGV
jgi:hypothetical protein